MQRWIDCGLLLLTLLFMARGLWITLRNMGRSKDWVRARATVCRSDGSTPPGRALVRAGPHIAFEGLGGARVIRPFQVDDEFPPRWGDRISIAFNPADDTKVIGYVGDVMGLVFVVVLTLVMFAAGVGLWQRLPKLW